MLVKVVREKAIGDAVPGKIYLDGNFYCYSLENRLYRVPNGYYSTYGKTSPKFGTDKLYFDVPGRSDIMFHGGNSPEDSRGCVLCGKNREQGGERISGDCSNELLKVVDAAYRRGEGVAVWIKGELSKTALVLIVAGVAGLIYMATK